MAKVKKARPGKTSGKARIAGYVITGRREVSGEAKLAFAAVGGAQITTAETIAPVGASMTIGPALAFRISRNLTRPTAADIAAAIDIVAAAAVVSRASGTGGIERMVLGASCSVEIGALNLPALGCLLERDGELVESAAGTPLLGNVFGAMSALAASSVASRGLRAGTLVMAAGIMPAAPLAARAHYTITFAHLGSVWVVTQ